MRRHIPRRAFLRGAGVALGLPFLPSLARRAEAAAPKRFLVYFVPNGVYIPAYMPKGAGTTYTLSETLMPIAPIREDVLICTGLTNTPGVPKTEGGAHASGMGALLTCKQYQKTGKLDLGKSVDQVAADAIGTQTKLPSLEIGIKDGENSDDIAILSTTLSYKGPATPAPAIENALTAFNRLFMGFAVDPNANAAEAAKRLAYRTSVLDVVLGDAKSLNPRLGKSDQKKLDEYMTSVRDVEMRAMANPGAGATCKIGNAPVNSTDFPTQLGLMHDLILLAFQCDATRVISLMNGYALGRRSFPWIGVNGDGHDVTHHGGDANKIAQTKKIDIWRIQQLVAFLQKMKAITDSDGKSLLYNTCVMYTSEVSHGDEHNQDNKVCLLAGQLGGAIKGGRVLEFPDGANGAFKPCDEYSTAGCSQPQLGNLYLTLLQAMGVNATTFGDTGKGVFTNLAG